MLHDFLFGDLYYRAGKISKRYWDTDKSIFDEKIKKIVELIKSQYEDIQYIVELIQELINDQIFDDGNSRTISVFFDNVINCYLDKDSEYKNKLKEALASRSKVR